MARVGDHDYRSFVGPPEQYDLMGATQFSLLCALGLREDHRLLDIGCGSLRAGRLFIAYLAPGGYTGLEPNRWLVEEALERDLGGDVVALKAPTFLHNDRFDVSGHEQFDFVLAQSIASHTGPAMTRSLLDAVREALVESGIAAITFVHDRTDSDEEGWTYPRTVAYRRQTVLRWAREAGLEGVPLAWYHPRQRWWAMVREGTSLPPLQLRLQARGAVLPIRRSWDLAARVRYGAPVRHLSGRLRRMFPRPRHGSSD